MKNKSFLKLIFLTIFLISLSNININAQFTSGNLVVLKVGDGTTALTSSGSPIFLQQFTPTGSLVNTITFPTTGTNPVCISGTASSEGQLTRSPDGSNVCVTGYKIAPPYTSSLSATTSAVINRVVLKVDNTGTISTAATTATEFSANNIRSAVSDGSGNYWAVGGTTGVFHFGATSSDTALVSNTSTNIRFVAIYNSQLYYSTAKGTNGVYQVGTGMPTTTGQTSVNVIPTKSTSSPYGFIMNATADICYIASDSLSLSTGGIEKWVSTSGVWSKVYTLGKGGSYITGYRSLAVDWSGTHPIIYATTADASANRIVKIIDTDSTVTPTVIATATTNTMYKGIAFAPTNNIVAVAPTVKTLSTSGITSNSAICYGNLVSDGNSAVTAMGICYGISLNPDIVGTHTSVAGAVGNFNANISSLTAGTTYHYRAYATNTIGISYGVDSTFTTATSAVAPVVTTLNYSNLAPFSVNINCNVLNDGGNTITARGVCYSTGTSPTLLNTHTSETGTTGTYTSSLAGLTQGTTYYVRAYATNGIGTSYGTELSFTTTYYIPTYTINQVKGINAQGVADSINTYCKLIGVVHGLNYANTGLSFYMMDANAGINVYSASALYGYNVTEGDRIRVIGKIQQTRGLIEILPDSIVKISTGNTLSTPLVVTTLTDANESYLIKMNSLTYISGWPTIAGPTATVLAKNGADTITIEIFSQCPLQGTAAPVNLFNIIGIQSQYTSAITPPFLTGYYILPRSVSDLILSVNDIQNEVSNISIYPNPSNGKFNVTNNDKNNLDVNIYTIQGSLIYHTTTNKHTTTFDISNFSKGAYFIKLIDTKTNNTHTNKLIIQ